MSQLRLARRLKRPAIALAVTAFAVLGLHQCVRWRHASNIETRLRQLAPLISKRAQANDLPPELVREVIRIESGGKADAVSPRNAKGLMQITPVTEQEVLLRTRGTGGNLFDPDYNLSIGTAYLRLLLDRFSGNWWLALAAYHLGPSRVQQLRGANPDLSGREVVERFAPPVTQDYCRRIISRAGLASANGSTPRPPQGGNQR